MKRWAWILCAILAVHFLGAEGKNLEQLKPVQLIYLRQEGDLLVLETDTGDWGTGKDLREALENLQAGADGRVFLETAEFLLLHQNAVGFLSQAEARMRPAARVCTTGLRADPEEAAKFLSCHKPDTSLLEALTGKKKPPELKLEKGRWRLGEGSSWKE